MKWYRIQALLLKYFYITKNRIDRIFDLFFWPILDIFLWGFMTLYLKQVTNLNLLSVALGGIILWMFVWRASQDIAVFVLEDFWSKNLYNLFSSPIRISELITSILLLGLLRALVSFIFMSGLAFILYSFNIFSIGIFNITFLVLGLILFGWTLGVFITSLIFIYGQRIQVFAWSIVWIIQPFSCIFYPLKNLPNWAQHIAKFVPTTQYFEGLRAIISNSPINWFSIIYAFITTVVLFSIAMLTLKYSLRIAKRKGKLAKPE